MLAAFFGTQSTRLHADFTFTAHAYDSTHSQNPYEGDDSFEPECPYNGPEHGLFNAAVPYPRYIVTGGAGFIGSHLVRRLAAQLGPGQVKVIDSLKNGHMASLQDDNGRWVINPQKDVCALDLRIEAHALKYLRAADYVYHLAATRGGSAQAILHDNVLINTNTLKACRVNNVTHYIYAGTAGNPLTFDIPQRSYVWSKRMGEYEAELAQSATFQVGILRFCSIYGPGSEFSGASSRLIPSLLRQAIQDPTEQFTLPAVQYIDLMYIEDAVDALLLMKINGMGKRAFDVCSGRAVSSAQIATIIAGTVGPALHKTIKPTFQTSPAVHGHGKVAGLARSKRVLGWQPRWTIQQGVAAVFSYVLEHKKRPNVLVVLGGQPRGGELAWKSLHRHLLMPHNAHLATYLTPVENATSRSMLEEMAQYVWRVPEPADGDWGVWVDKVAALCPHSPSSTDWHRLCQRPGQIWGGGFKKCPHISKSGVVMVYRWLISQKVTALNLHNQYDYIIYTRPDFLYLCDHPSPTAFNKSAISVPLGEEWGGYTDRHMVGTASMSLRAINIAEELVCNVEKYLDLVSPLENNEQVQAVVWKQLGLTVQQYPRVMFTVRAAHDPASWSKGHLNISNHVEHHGLKVKYPGEYSSAVAACKATNVSEHLLRIQQHSLSLFL